MLLPRPSRWLVGGAALAAVAACQPSPPPPAPPAVVAAPSSSIPEDIGPTVTALNAALEAAWTGQSIQPAPDVDDATFLRRVTLDLAGRIPSVDEARAFLDDERPDKRSRWVAALVESDDWARHWTNHYDRLLMEGGRAKVVDRSAFRQWLYATMRRERGWDRVVTELVAAEGINSEGGRPDIDAYSLRTEAAAPEGVHGGVNWLLRHGQAPQNLAGATARVFLGVQIQCAECHDHPTESWTQDDFRHFTAAFLKTQGRPLDRGRVMGLRRVEVRDVERLRRRRARKLADEGYDGQAPRALDGTALDEAHPRRALATWLTAADNPWFARATVNRMWGALLGRGFVDPVDDLRAGRTPEVPAALEVLERDFVAHGFDLRRLHRIIASSRAYRLAPRDEAPLFSGFRLRPMDDAQLLDGLLVATRIEPVLEEVVGSRRARVERNLRRQFHFAFDVDEETADDTFTGTIPQALMLMNGPLNAAGSSALEGSTVGYAASLGDVDAAVEHLYLAALSRRPSADELAHWRHYLATTADADRPRPRGGGPVGRLYRRTRIDAERIEAFEDLFWALLASSEFFFIH